MNTRTLLLLLSCLTLPLAAQDNLPRTAETFEIGGNKAVVYAAPKTAEGKPWLWYAPTLNGGVSIVGRKMYSEAFMKAGISIAGFDLGEVRGSPASTAKFTLFYDEMVKRGYSPKPILLGQSRGGMMTLAWAFRNPDKVRAWVGIYPVCNLASWPLKNSKPQTLADFAMTEPELVAKLSEFNPIDNLAGLAANKVPMFAVHGDNDVVVPYDLNTKLLKSATRPQAAPSASRSFPAKGIKSAHRSSSAGSWSISSSVCRNRAHNTLFILNPTFHEAAHPSLRPPDHGCARAIAQALHVACGHQDGEGHRLHRGWR